MKPAPHWATSNDGPVVITGVKPEAEGSIEGQVAVLPSGLLAMKRLRDGNGASPSASVIQTVDFHPFKENWMLTGGLDKTLKIFEFHDKSSVLKQSVYFADLPISMAKFTADGSHVIVTGRRPYYYVYDIQAEKAVKITGLMMGFCRQSNRTISPAAPSKKEEKTFERFFVSPKNDYLAFTGSDGYVHLVRRTSQQWVTSLRMNDEVRWLDFSADGNTLFGIGHTHELYQWDLRNNFKCVARVKDFGALKGSCLKVSPCQTWLACGSATGVVSIYRVSDLVQSEDGSITPVKVIDNLTTYINALHFSHDGQLLSIQSRSMKNGLRFLHLPSFTVFSNGPMMSNLGYVNAVAISKKSKFVASGNDKGIVQLFKLEHYAKLQ